MTRKEAVAAFGSVSTLADALGITEQAVYGWGEEVPELRIYQIKCVLAERDAA